jgi:rhodanese-related sulfurtransferase
MADLACKGYYATVRWELVEADMLAKNSTRVIIGAIVVAVIILYAQGLTSGEKTGYGDVNVERARELIEARPDLVILDVMSPAESDDGHIEGAVNIPVDSLGGRLGELDKRDELLVYCRIGNRSRRATGILRDNGFTKIYHMVGGIEGWRAAGYPPVQ